MRLSKLRQYLIYYYSINLFSVVVNYKQIRFHSAQAVALVIILPCINYKRRLLLTLNSFTVIPNSISQFVFNIECWDGLILLKCFGDDANVFKRFKTNYIVIYQVYYLEMDYLEHSKMLCVFVVFCIISRLVLIIYLVIIMICKQFYGSN